MRRILAGLALALLIASPVLAKGGASITAGDGPYSFGQTVATFDLVTAWEPKNGRQPDFGYWARADCYANETTVVGDPDGDPTNEPLGPGDRVYIQAQSLTLTVQQGGFTFGPTPSWSGGGADCTIRLFAMVDGTFGSALASDDFTVSP